MKKISKIASLAFLAALLFNGCKKDQNKSTTGVLPVQTVTAASIPDGMVMTPQGLMPTASVHLVENGYHLELRGNHVLKIQTATGEMKEDFGAIKVATPTQAPTVNASNTATGTVAENGMNRAFVSSAPNGSDWMTYAEYSAGTTTPIGLCQTTWTVPAAPTTSGAQIYIGNGVENGAHSNSAANLVIEPALLYGNNGATGTSSTGWTISNWCAWGTGAAYTTPAAVTVGASLTGIVTLTNYVSPNYEYTSAFNGQSNALTVLYNSTVDVTGTAMPSIPIENYAFESLQAYGLTSANEYPNQNSVNMTNILIETGTAGSGGSFTTPTSLSWLNYATSQAIYGEHTIIGPNTTQTNPTPNTTGEVQLWFGAVTPPATFPLKIYLIPTISGTSYTCSLNIYENGVLLTPSTIAINPPGGPVTVNVTATAYTNATFVLQVSPYGYMPPSATMNGSGISSGTLNGVVSGHTITFSGINAASMGSPATIAIYLTY
jgi:hypothetical protein